MHIVLCTDSNYVLPARVTVCSICSNNVGQELNFHIVTDKSSVEAVKTIKEEVDKWGQSFYCYPVDPAICAELPIGRPNQPVHPSIVCYYRLFLTSLLPETVDKVLYFDCDMIVRQNILNLWNTDISGRSVLACDDMYNLDPEKYNTLKYYPSEGYFNSGFLVINLKYWRENNMQSKFIEYARTYPERIVFHDQDIMNVVLKDCKGRLPFKYNVQDGYLYETIHFLKWPYEDEYEEAIKDPCTIHYSIRFKPWHEDSNHPWKAEYLKYVGLAGLDLKDFPQRNEHLSLYQRLRAIFVKLGFFQPLIQFRSGIEI